MTVVHLSVGPHLTRCGRTTIPTERLTRNRDEVSCSVCNGTAGSKIARTLRRRTFYEGSGFKGTGLLTCTGCGRPYRDHAITERCVA